MMRSNETDPWYRRPSALLLCRRLWQRGAPDTMAGPRVGPTPGRHSLVRPFAGRRGPSRFRPSREPLDRGHLNTNEQYRRAFPDRFIPPILRLA